MTLSPDEAAETLGEIARAEKRSAQAHEYANASPFFILWGVVWIFGYAGSDLLPRLFGNGRAANWLWMALTVIGLVSCFTLGRHQYRAQYPGAAGAGRREGLRWLGSMLVIWIFLIAAALVIGPRMAIVQGAFIPLLVAMFYGLLGVWKGLRFLYAGIAVTTLTLGGFFYLPEHFLLWMAMVGGGSLVLVGLWLRKV